MSALGKWVIPPPRKTLVVGVADMVASNDPGSELVTHSLGSCLGITAYDPVNKVGGLLHLMLPDGGIDSAKAEKSPFMFVTTGVPRLFHAIYNLGAERRRVVIKAAGGSQLLDEKGIFNIGQRNYQALTEILSRNGHSIQAWDIGGNSSRTMRFDLETGRVTIKCPGTNLYYL